jgi:hypothetical protein
MGMNKRVDQLIYDPLEISDDEVIGAIKSVPTHFGMNKPDIHDYIVNARTMLFWDDFEWYSSGQKWTSVTTGGGASVAINSTGVGGLLTLTTGASKNNEAGVISTNAPFTFQNGTNNVGTPVIFQCEINYSEQDTSNAGIVVGLSSNWTNILADNTWALPASFSGALVYKTPGSTTWSLATSVGTTQLTQNGGNTCLYPAVNQRIIIQCFIDVAGYVEVTASVGTPGTAGNSGVVGATVLGQATGGVSWLLPNFNTSPSSRATPIKQYVAFSGAAAMKGGVFLKAGSGTSQPLSVDYVGVEYLARP